MRLDMVELRLLLVIEEHVPHRQRQLHLMPINLLTQLLRVVVHVSVDTLI
jgi:hypothetical protein